MTIKKMLIGTMTALVTFIGVTVLGVTMFVGSAAYALKSDKSQPAIINADEVEIDFKTGDRTYIGNVEIVQGTMRLTADKLIAQFENNKLKSATAFGNPAVFRQRPDDADGDVVAEAKSMVIDEQNQLVTLNKDAKITQPGGASMESQKIVYNMETQKMSAGGGTTTTKPAETTNKKKSSSQTSPAASPSASNAPSIKKKNVKAAKAQTPTKQKQSTDKKLATTKTAKTVKQEVTDTVKESAKEKIQEKAVAATENTAAASSTNSGRMRIVIPPKNKTLKNK